MYQYWRLSHKTHLLLEEENKLLIEKISLLKTEGEIKKASWNKLWQIQQKLNKKQEKFKMEIPRPEFGIAVDGFCKGNPGPCGYRGVDIETGEILFGNKNLGLGTNNIAEYIGIVHALMYCKKKKKHTRVYSDSEIAIAWVKSKNVNSTFDGTKNPEIIQKLWHCQMWLSEQKTYNDVDKWFTNAWGEIPADFGNKR